MNKFLIFTCVIFIASACTKNRKMYSAAKLWGDSDKPSSKTKVVPSGRFEMGAADEDISGEYISSKGHEQPENLSGMLTAGEVNDFSKWDLWKEYSNDEFDVHSKNWAMKPHQRYTVQVNNKDGYAVVDASVALLDSNDQVIWKSKTDNTGKAELWHEFMPKGGSDKKPHSIKITYKNATTSITQFHGAKAGLNVVTLDEECSTSDIVDIAFVVDATSSMSDEISYLKSDLKSIITKAKDKHSTLQVNLGSVFYRDHTDEYLTKASDLSTNIDKAINFVAEQSAGGGGDYPEAVDAGLDKALNFNWSENARARLLFLVLDAPPHSDSATVRKMQQLASEASDKGIRIIPITASGVNKSTEYLMRTLALASNGTYVFLTDDSGIGNSHIKPTTDHYDVELLNDLIGRLIDEYVFVADCDVELPAIDPTSDTLTVYRKATEIEMEEQEQENAAVSTDSLEAIQLQIEINKCLESFKAYPNPVSDIVNIYMECPTQEIYISDIRGKLIGKYEYTGGEGVQVNMEQLPAGIYFVRYIHEGLWRSQKILKVNY